MRTALATLVVGFGTFGALALVVYIAFVIGSSTNSVVLTLVFFVISLFFVMFFAKKLMEMMLAAGRKSIKEWLVSVEGFKYKEGWDGTGMALDPDRKLVSLLGTSKKGSITKNYPLSDVREWGFDIPSYSTSGSASVVLYGDSLAMNAAMLANNAAHSFGEATAATMDKIRALENTNFWIKVKDVDHPVWKIKFNVNLSEKDLRATMDRWMEIMEQHVNEDKPAV